MRSQRIISTPINNDPFERLESFCAEIHRTRAEVMRGLLYALLIPEKEFIFDEWQKVARSLPRCIRPVPDHL